MKALVKKPKPKFMLPIKIQYFSGTELTLDAVKQYLADNKANADVAAYLGELSRPNAEGVKGFLETDEGKKLIQPRLDLNFTKGLETWKANNLETLVNDELAKRNPAQTEEQKRIAALEKALEDQKKEAQREKLTNIAMKHATEKQLPTDLINFFLADDEDGTTANLGKFEETFTKAVQAAVESKFKSNGRDIAHGSGSGKDSGEYGKQLATEFNSNVDNSVKAQENYFG
jgi:Domain of unknown function (DUF4355)